MKADNVRVEREIGGVYALRGEEEGVAGWRGN